MISQITDDCYISASIRANEQERTRRVIVGPSQDQAQHSGTVAVAQCTLLHVSKPVNMRDSWFLSGHDVLLVTTDVGPPCLDIALPLMVLSLQQERLGVKATII